MIFKKRISRSTPECNPFIHLGMISQGFIKVCRTFETFIWAARDTSWSLVSSFLIDWTLNTWKWETTYNMHTRDDTGSDDNSFMLSRLLANTPGVTLNVWFSMMGGKYYLKLSKDNPHLLWNNGLLPESARYVLISLHQGLCMKLILMLVALLVCQVGSLQF